MKRIQSFPILTAFILVSLAMCLAAPTISEFQSFRDLKESWRNLRLDLAVECAGAGFAFLLSYLLWELPREYAAKQEELAKKISNQR